MNIMDKLIKNKYLVEWINDNYSTMIEDGDSCLCELDYYDMDKFANWLVEKLKIKTVCDCFPNYPDDDKYACMSCGLPLIEE